MIFNQNKHFNFHWKHKNLLIVFLGAVIGTLVSQSAFVNQILSNLGNFGYLGAFIAGILFVSTFTVVTGSVILVTLTHSLNPFLIALIAGLGGVFGDLVIMRFVKDDISNEVSEIFNEIDPRHHFRHLIHSRYFNWTLPVIGTFIIASPLPDELGVSMIGLSSMKAYKFFILSFFLHFAGVVAMVITPGIFG